MSRKFAPPSLLLAVTLLSTAAGHAAEDIDIFRPSNADGAGKPNVLFVIDNGASWEATIGSTKAHIMIHQALHTVITDPDLLGKVNLGMMTFTKTSTTNSNGGKVVAHISEFDSALRDKLSCVIYEDDTDSDGVCDTTRNIEKNNNTPHAQSFYEAYLYFMGLSPRSGLETANVTPHDPAAYNSSTGRYNSPSADNPCASNFIIFIGTGTPDSADNGPGQTLLTALGGVYPSDPIALSPNNYQTNWSDEFARYLANNADVASTRLGNQNIRTYTIDVFDDSVTHNNPFLAARAYFNSIATQGDGTYFAADDADKVADAIKKILNEIQSVNSVFASVSLPISVNVQGTNQNQVYIGMFRPDGNLRPHWVGNIKRYQYLFSDTGTPYLAGADEQPAYNAATGFISPSAVSYWTEDDQPYDNYWGYKWTVDRDLAYEENTTWSDLPDGDVVEKGAAGQRLRVRDPAARTLVTCSTCGANSTLATFDSSNANVTGALSPISITTTVDAVSTTTTYTVAEIVDWVRGHDVRDENADSDVDEARPSIHGDVLHSRPAVVNYHRTATDDVGEDVVIFYGVNDGIFRAVNGEDGAELWGFIAPEHYTQLETLFSNNPADSGQWHPYFMDGNPSVIVLDVNNDKRIKAESNDKAYLYTTMRRGGRSIYALDVTVPENSPTLMWRKRNSDSGFSEMGQTWSTPTPAYVQALGTSTPVLFFGLGYDTAEDSALPVDANRSMGRGIMMVDAVTGAPIWQAGPNPTGATYNKTVADMTYAIPSDVRLVNRSGNDSSFAEFLYVGDVGGNVWRADIRDADPQNWTVTKLASVGDCVSGVTECRKFLYAPSIVFGDSYDSVLIGSGNRERPSDMTQNYFFMFKDTRDIGTGVTGDPATIVFDDLMDVTDLTTAEMVTTANQTTFASKRGWRLRLKGAGEKTVGHAITLSGTTLFYTNTPPSGNSLSCESNLGTAREYFVNYLYGTPGSTMGDTPYHDLPGGGYPPPPVPMTLPNPRTSQPWTGPGGLNPEEMGGSSFGRRQRTFWYKSRD